jgi:hypothetical protein
VAVAELIERLTGVLLHNVADPAGVMLPAGPPLPIVTVVAAVAVPQVVDTE